MRERLLVEKNVMNDISIVMTFHPASMIYWARCIYHCKYHFLTGCKILVHDAARGEGESERAREPVFIVS